MIATDHEQLCSWAADLDAVMRRVSDLELFPSHDFWAEAKAIAKDIRGTADAVARHSAPLADELRVIADEMKDNGGGDHWDREDFKKAVLSDLEPVHARLRCARPPAHHDAPVPT